MIRAFKEMPEHAGQQDTLMQRDRAERDCANPAPTAEREAGCPVQSHPISKTQLSDKTIKSQ